MPGDLRNPLGGLTGYQFWALLGVSIIIAARVLLAYNIPLGPFTITIVEGSGTRILVSDALGTLIVVSAYNTYTGFVDRAITE